MVHTTDLVRILLPTFNNVSVTVLYRAPHDTKPCGFEMLRPRESVYHFDENTHLTDPGDERKLRLLVNVALDGILKRNAGAEGSSKMDHVTCRAARDAQTVFAIR